MAKASTSNAGLKALIAYYKELFRIPENLDHYHPEDYKIAEKKFLKYLLYEHIESYPEKTDQ